jgi:hypothetical protein
MSTPTNGAARNAMSEFERQCYDWGWEDNEERIIKLLEKEISEWLSHDGTCDCRIRGEEGKRLLALIKGENK